MKALGEVSFAVIAEVFGKTESWARVTYHRARMKIFEKLGENKSVEVESCFLLRFANGTAFLLF